MAMAVTQVMEATAVTQAMEATAVTRTIHITTDLTGDMGTEIMENTMVRTDICMTSNNKVGK